jgi:hypothetical protein
MVINWQQCYGGSDDDIGTRIAKAKDGYYLFGTTISLDGQVTGNHGISDYWVIKTDTMGNLLWSKTYGGSSYDELKQVKPTADGGFILFGESFSTDGDVQGNHGGFDYWVVKIDSLGNLLWQKCLGGSYNELAGDFDTTPDSGFICIGAALSNDGDVTGNHGNYDYWVVKLDKNGNIKRETCFGGSFPDLGLSITSTNDGGAILSGWTGLNDGDVQCNYHGGQSDAWIVKLDSTGSIEWQQCYGGSQDEDIYLTIPLSDGGYLCAGNTTSNDGDVSGNHGLHDFWVLKIDHWGNLLSQKCFGGSDMEDPNFMKATSDGNYIIGGYTLSNNGDVSGNHSDPGGSDIWLIKITPDLRLIWQQCIGGKGREEGFDLLEVGPGKYMLLGSKYGYGYENCYGRTDMWLVSLTDTTTIGIAEINQDKNPLLVYPNPASKEVVFEYKNFQSNAETTLKIYNEFGEKVKEFSRKDMQGKISWNSEQVSSGLYFYQLINKDNIRNGKFIIHH